MNRTQLLCQFCRGDLDGLHHKPWCPTIAPPEPDTFSRLAKAMTEPSDEYDYECPECCVAIDLDCDSLDDGRFACIACDWVGPLDGSPTNKTLDEIMAKTQAAQIRRMTGGA